MIEQVIFPILVHVGNRLVDLVMKPASTPSPTAEQRQAVVRVPGTDAAHRGSGYEVLRGRIFIQDTFRRAVRPHENTYITLLNAGTRRHTLLGPLSKPDHYQIQLRPGTYTIAAVVVDSRAATFSDAEVYAFGFPCSEHLASHFGFRRPDDIWDLIDRSPTTISAGGGPYHVHFLVLGVDDLPGRPRSFEALRAIGRNVEGLEEEDDDDDHLDTDEDGRAIPEAGYDWLDKRNTRDLRVTWQPGTEHPDHAHVLAGDEEGTWEAEAGYDWANKRNPEDLRVKWQPGAEHPDYDHVIADEEEGAWQPAPHYRWVNGDDSEDWRVKRSRSR